MSFLRSGLSVVLCGLLAGACATADSEAPESAGRGVEHVDGWTDEALDVYFIPQGAAAEDRIADEVAGATREIRVAMYNIRSDRLGWLLLDKQNQGVDVEVLWDAKQMAKEYNTLDDELIAAGLHVVPVLNERSEYATLHDKLAVIDGERVILGSANWGYSALFENNESLLVLTSPAAAAVVDAELDEVASGVKVPRPGDADSRVQLYFSPEDRLDLRVEEAIDAAEERIYVAVFSLRLRSLSEALVRARDRGVAVYVMTDAKQAATAWEDDYLRDHGIDVVEALNATTDFTAMHHKLAVIDGRTTLVGAYNWTYTATFHSYEDLAVIADDAEVAAAFEGEIGRLWQRYAPDRPNPVTRTVPIEIAADCDRTQWGDELVLVGDLPELGGWDPHRGVRLSGADWPTWRASVDLPIGRRIEYKLVLLRADGSVQWEQGGNRIATLPTDGGEPPLVLADAFRY